jgi:proteasome activator subunit 4
VEKTKSERGYSGTGSLINNVLHTLSSVYTLNNRFVNTAEWEDPGIYLWLYHYCLLTIGKAFDNDHDTQWGRLYEASEVKLEWHGRYI